MCTVSMVYDHFKHRFPEWIPSMPQVPFVPPQVPVLGAAEIEQLRKLIEDFRKAVEAAKTVDALTKQPDCEDPEKARLREHVARLEKMIDALLAAKDAK